MEENDEEEQEDEDKTAEEESPLSESPQMDVGEEGSGGYEGSAAEGPYITGKSDLGVLAFSERKDFFRKSVVWIW